MKNVFQCESLECRQLMSASYQVVPLNGPVGQYGVDISSSGQVLATNNSAGGVWNQAKNGNQLNHAGLLSGGAAHRASAINGQNMVVGRMGGKKNAPQQATAWFFQKGAGYTPKKLGALQPGGYSGALGVSELGQIVGFSDDAQGQSQAFLATVKKGKVTMVDLNTYVPDAPDKLTLHAAWDMNSAGQIAVIGGKTTDSRLSESVVLRVSKKGNSMRKLPGLNNPYARATGINEAGQVIGEAITNPANYDTRAVRWNLTKNNVTVTDLGSLGGENSAAVDINNAGQIVGWSDINDEHDSHGFLWTPNKNGGGGTMIDLQQFLPKGSKLTILYANGINDKGEIAAHAEDQNGKDYTVLLRPGAAAAPQASVLNTKPAFSTKPIEQTFAF